MNLQEQKEFIEIFYKPVIDKIKEWQDHYDMKIRNITRSIIAGHSDETLRLYVDEMRAYDNTIYGLKQALEIIESMSKEPFYDDEGNLCFKVRVYMKEDL